jgi:hypothetical protein
MSRTQPASSEEAFIAHGRRIYETVYGLLPKPGDPDPYTRVVETWSGLMLAVVRTAAVINVCWGGQRGSRLLHDFLEGIEGAVFEETRTLEQEVQ